MKDRNKAYVGVGLILVAIVLGIWQFSARQAFVIEANALSAEVTNLTTQENRLVEQYQALKTDVSGNRESAAQQIDLVFPTSDKLTDLTRLFDDFEVKNNFSSNPFFISSINYAGVTEEDNYRVLPFTIKLTSSKKNFLKFLEFVEGSGSLEGEVRLMSIEDFNVSYPAEFGGAYEITATLNAYFSREL